MNFSRIHRYSEICQMESSDRVIQIISNPSGDCRWFATDGSERPSTFCRCNPITMDEKGKRRTMGAAAATDHSEHAVGLRAARRGLDLLTRCRAKDALVPATHRFFNPACTVISNKLHEARKILTGGAAQKRHNRAPGM
ncbi:hypothetical protein HT746_25760 [Burkholderia pyrrocinia]|uniref:hypothetical protein n=1 Tax=Burkholderia pyrrocinia TaxID=60550 RepID=UPI001576E886|nr:hypothetical protein [Burkholderia pyrrocinia]NTX30483.1 hypothetical protein [Burkholderia pyrrocinia]